MNSCPTCGALYDGDTHNCGWVTITKDRLRELETAERELRILTAEVPYPREGEMRNR